MVTLRYLAGLEIATDTVASATNVFSLATKILVYLVATLATRFLLLCFRHKKMCQIA